MNNDTVRRITMNWVSYHLLLHKFCFKIQVKRVDVLRFVCIITGVIDESETDLQRILIVTDKVL